MTARQLVFYVIFTFSCIAAVKCEEDLVQKYKNYTPAQIKALPEKELKATVPIMYTFAANRGMMRSIPLIFGMELNSLMYPGLDNYSEAIKLFQADLGDNPTGTLTVWQIHQLQMRSDAQRLGTVGFPDTYSSWISNEFAKVEGTVKIIDENIAWPVNHVEIVCHKAEKYCEYKQIVMQFPNDSSWSQTYAVTPFKEEFYKIINWENGIIDALPAEATGCRSNALKLNFNNKEFFEVVSNTSKDCETAGIKFDRLSKPRISQIVDGSQIIVDEFNRIRDRSFGFLSSKFRKRLDDAFEPQKAN